jgi:DNA-binding XRE family transcriptional regulator
MPERTPGWLTPQDYAEHDETLQAFAERLRTVRERAGLTQEQLDAPVYAQRGTVSRMEHGHTAPKLFTLLQLADSLNVGPGELLNGLPVPKRTATLDRVLVLIETNPGITTNQIADDLGISANYAMRLIRSLVTTHAISSQRGGWKA